jgi:hypothetical protein
MGDNDPRHQQLHDAISCGNDGTALSIVKGGVDVNGEWDGTTHLRIATRCDSAAVVACLLKLGAEADKISSGIAGTPLNVAVSRGLQQVTELLVEMGNAQVNLRGDWGSTPLHHAAREGKLEPAKYLVSRGCSLNVQNYEGDTPYDTANSSFYPGNPQAEVAQLIADATHLTAEENYRGLLELCAPFSSPYFERKIIFALRYEFLLCLLATKEEQIEDMVAPSSFPSITLTSRLYDHEQGLVRLILSYVGLNQEEATDWGVD